MSDGSLEEEMAQPSEGQQSGEEAADALREAEMRYRTVADFTYDWEVWQAPDGSLRYVSPSCERITGYPAKAFLDNPHLTDELILPQDREAWRQHRRAIEARVPQEIQFRIRRPEGGIRWI
jgi:PAS domain S-box-containing protein